MEKYRDIPSKSSIDWVINLVEMHLYVKEGEAREGLFSMAVVDYWREMVKETVEYLRWLREFTLVESNDDNSNNSDNDNSGKGEEKC